MLRDAILHLLEDDPTLEPRDIIVMCPDIEHFAPLIQATFGGHDLSGDGDGPEDPTRSLEIRLADRSLRQTNPVLGVLAEVLELSTARITATEVLDLAGRDPVRRRFRFGDDDLFRLEEWVQGAFVRWGFDAEHRASFQLSDIGANTWEAGVDRILLGSPWPKKASVSSAAHSRSTTSTTATSTWLVVSPSSLTLVHVLDLLDGDRDIGEWAEILADLGRVTATARRDGWQRAELTALPDGLVEEATVEGVASAVELPVTMCAPCWSTIQGSADPRQLLHRAPDRVHARPHALDPGSVVCLLGLDDGSFPRHIEKDGDDLTTWAPLVGDRYVRSEDRQFLLDELFSAREHLVITYSGRDEHSNLHRPPAVPVGELLDVVDHTVRGVDGHRARDAIVVAHPLQPFDPRNFEAGELVGDTPWSFDRLHLAGAQAALAPRHRATGLLDPTAARLRHHVRWVGPAGAVPAPPGARVLA